MCSGFKGKGLEQRKLLYLQISIICFRPTEGAAKQTQSFWGDHFFTFMPRVGPFQHTIQQHLLYRVFIHSIVRHPPIAPKMSRLQGQQAAIGTCICKHLGHHAALHLQFLRHAAGPQTTHNVIYFASSLAKLVDNY